MDSSAFDSFCLTLYLFIHVFKTVVYFYCCMRGCVPSCFSRVQLFVTPWIAACQAPLSIGFSGKNTVVGCHALLQRIFLTQGSNSCLLCLLHW